MTLIPLVAGSLTMAFDTDIAFLRYVHWGETEVLRGLFAAVRDANWNTFRFRIDDLQVEQASDSFALKFHANGLGAEPPFRWTGELLGNSGGTVEYRFRGVALRTFLRNRIGLCALHPIDTCAGAACHIEHVDGSCTRGSFPSLISPHQPFKNIRAITHALSSNLHFRVTMLGDTFEMEDQRNWTDASFKTYGTPLNLPFPVEVPAGTVVEQVVRLELVGESQRSRAHADRQTVEPCRIEVAWTQPRARPKIGLGLAPLDEPLAREVLDQLQLMRPDHLRIDLLLDQPQWRAELEAASELAQGIGCQLELALFFTSSFESQCRELIDALQSNQPPVARVLLFDAAAKTTPERLSTAVGEELRQFDSDLRIVVGTNAYFAELNRGRPTRDDSCLVCYSLNPQVHAFDNLSIAETLQAQRDTVDSAVEIFSAEVVVSPITLRPRYNPNATSKLDRRLELVTAIDPRQSSGFAAAWTAGVLAKLATHPRVESLTLFETHGPRGVMGTSGESHAMTSMLTTVLRSHSTLATSCSQPLHVIGFGVQQQDQMRQVIIGNLSDRPHMIEITGAAVGGRCLEVPAASVRVVAWEDLNDA